MARMTFRELVLSVDGMRSKYKFYHDLIRRATLIIGCSGFGGKEVAKRFDKDLWPVESGNENPKIQDRAYEQLKKFREIDEKRSDEQKVKDILDARRRS